MLYESGHPENLDISARELQLQLLATSLSAQSYPGYPLFSERLFLNPSLENYTESGRRIIPDGPWVVNTHVNRPDHEIVPTEEEQRTFIAHGLELDSMGRPLHPWFIRMAEDPAIGIVTGKGAYWKWGPNKTVDPIIIQSDHVLLIKRNDTGTWAFPGGFVDKNEAVESAGRREVLEETGLVLPEKLSLETVYSGPVVDIRLSGNAWPETTALLMQIPSHASLPMPHGMDDAADAAWVPINIALQENGLFGSHRFLLDTTLNLL